MTETLNLLLISILTSLQIAFIHILFWDGMIFSFAKDNRINELITKPLYSCLICMTSIWGFFFWLVEWQATVNIFWFLLTVGGINVLISGIIGRAEDVNGEMFVKSSKA